MSTQTKGFYISTSGDKSVGIFPGSWTLEGEFHFEDKEALEDFRKELSQLFADHVAGEPAGIQTFEERQEQLRKEDEFLNQQTEQ